MTEPIPTAQDRADAIWGRALAAINGDAGVSIADRQAQRRADREQFAEARRHGLRQRHDNKLRFATRRVENGGAEGHRHEPKEEVAMATENNTMPATEVGDQAAVSLARSVEALLESQLRQLDALERRATEPDQVVELFRIDHLATRARRRIENLLEVAGRYPVGTRLRHDFGDEEVV